MPNDPNRRIHIPNSPEFFPATALVKTGLWACLTPPAKAVLLVLWDYHREYPDACHPTRETLARHAGISPPSVSNALTTLEEHGIVQTIPTPGPRPNTYKLQWSDLRAPKTAPACSGSPYRRPSADWEPHMGTDAEGNAVTKYERKGGGHHRMSDGCVVRGQVEMVIHDLLIAWGIPHWSEVGYCDLGIVLRHAKSGDLNRQATVDFVVAPGLIVERLGLPATQAAAKKYRAKATAKVKAARDAGWTVLIIEPDQRPGDWLLEPIRQAWADATVEEATRLRRLLQRAGKYEKTHGPSLELDAHLKDAKARLAGAKEPQKSRGLTMQADNEHGFRVTYRCDPRIVLMEQARGAPDDNQRDDWFDELPVAHEPPRPPDLHGPDEEMIGRMRDLADEIADLDDQVAALGEDDDDYHALQIRRGELDAKKNDLEAQCYMR